MGPVVPNWSNPPVTTAGAQERAENIRGPQPRYGGSSPAQTLVRTGGDMDGLLEKFVPGGHRGVQLIAYSWELADRILSIGGGCVFVGDREAAITEPRSAPIPLVLLR